MIELGNISFLGSWVLDVILILISASACFYCALLSRRLKALNGLEEGVGASIVSLTDAIGKTHDAAREAQGATHETVETLRFLLEKCESMAPQIEASLSELDSELKAARKIRTELRDTVTPGLEGAVHHARTTAQGLLKIVEAVKVHQTAKAASVPPLKPRPVTAERQPSQPSAVVKPFKKTLPEAGSAAKTVKAETSSEATSAPLFASNLSVLDPLSHTPAKAVNS